jgi:hypothetical protein
MRRVSRLDCLTGSPAPFDPPPPLALLCVRLFRQFFSDRLNRIIVAAGVPRCRVVVC